MAELIQKHLLIIRLIAGWSIEGGRRWTCALAVMMNIAAYNFGSELQNFPYLLGNVICYLVVLPISSTESTYLYVAFFVCVCVCVCVS